MRFGFHHLQEILLQLAAELLELSENLSYFWLALFLFQIVGSQYKIEDNSESLVYIFLPLSEMGYYALQKNIRWFAVACLVKKSNVGSFIFYKAGFE